MTKRKQSQEMMMKVQLIDLILTLPHVGNVDHSESQNTVEWFSAKAARWKTEKDVYKQIWGQCLGNMQNVGPLSDSINDNFDKPFGPFGFKRFKNEVAFKMYLQRRIKASVGHKDVSTAKGLLLLYLLAMKLLCVTSE